MMVECRMITIVECRLRSTDTKRLNEYEGRMMHENRVKYEDRIEYGSQVTYGRRVHIKVDY